MLAAHTRVPFGLAPARHAVIRTSRVPSVVVRVSARGSPTMSARASRGCPAAPPTPPAYAARAPQASQAGEERTLSEKLALPAAALLGAALMFAATPDAAEAARSGGRVGGSGGFAARRR